MKFLQTLPSTGVNQSEDSEVSDRDLPELAPIDIKDYQRKGKKNCFRNLFFIFKTKMKEMSNIGNVHLVKLSG